MTSKKKAVISLILNILICISSFYALTRYFYSTGDGNMQVKGVESLRYFTNLSNYYVAIASAIMIPYGIKNIKNEVIYPQWLIKLKHSATVTVTLTFLTCVVFLGPLTALRFANYWGFFKGYLFIFSGNVFYLHFLTPIMAIVGFSFFDCGNNLTKKNALGCTIPVFIYGVLYFYKVMYVGAENGGWYDFYSFTFGGKVVMIPIVAVIMFFVTYGIANIERKIYNKRC